ncbi:MAG: hypothetical protein U0V87_15190 [Acidobacteriota bacterium]
MVWASPREVAESLGVSESSVKRWCDDGRLDTERTAGGHRRIAVAEALRFARSSNLSIMHPEILGLAGIASTLSRSSVLPTDLGDALFELLQRDEAGAAQRLAFAAFAEGHSIASLCDGPLRSSLARIGELWKQSPEGIVAEHRAVDICYQLMARLRNALPDPDSDALVAVGGAPSGDPYLLPSAMAAAVVHECGVLARNVGADTPAEALIAAIVRYKAQMVWISVTREGADEIAPPYIEAVRRAARDHGALVIAGGRALSPRAVRPGEGLHLFATMAELASFTRGLLNRK